MHGRSALVGLVVGVILVGAIAPQPHASQVLIQTQPTGPDTATVGTGAVSGVVTDGVTGQPLVGALVRLSGAGRGGPGVMPRQMTDARGRFIFTRLPAFENYTLSASKPGYFDAWYKQTPGINVTVRLELADGQWFREADVTLWRPAAISGTVRDELGDPLVGVPVRALVIVRVAGRERWASGPAATTDDRGMYRLAGLRPGAYVIQVPSVQLTLPGEAAAAATAVAPPSSGGVSTTGRTDDPLTMMRADATTDLRLLVGHFPTPLPGSGATAYPMAFHPTARALDQAAPVTVDYGDERSGVDVQMQLVPTVRVSGRLTGNPEVVGDVPVRIVPASAEEVAEGGEVALTRTDGMGAFTFLRVPAGDYVVVASSTQAGYSSAVSGTAASQVILPNRGNLFSGSLSSGSIAGTDNVRYTTRSSRGTGAYGRLPLGVGDQDITDVVIPVTAGVVVSGHLLWDGSPTPPAGTQRGPLLRLEPADGDLSVGLPNSGLTRPSPNQAADAPIPFEIERVQPGRYVFGGSLAVTGYALEAIEHGGRNLLETPLVVEAGRDVTGIVVRLTSQTMSLTGYVRDASGAPADSGAVLFFPADRNAWRDYGLGAQRFKTATITSRGSYRAPALQPGEYYLAAVADSDRARWTDPEFLQTLLPWAVRLTVTPGLNTTQDLQLQGGR